MTARKAPTPPDPEPARDGGQLAVSALAPAKATGDWLPTPAGVERLRAKLAHVLPPPLDPHALSSEARAWVARNKRDSLRPNTLEAIVVSYRYWVTWYGLRYAQAMTLPLTVATVLQFLVDHAGRDVDGRLVPQLPAAIDAALMAEGVKGKRRNPQTGEWEPTPWKLSTLKLRVAALSILHQLRGLPNPFADVEVRDQLRRITRIAHAQGQGPRGKPAATAATVDQLSTACEVDGSARAVRDRALLWFGFASGGRRRSEIAGALLSDLQRVGEGFLFHMRTSKTNVTGEVETKPVFDRAAEYLEDWLALRGSWPGPLFCRIDRRGEFVRREDAVMSDESVRLAVLRWTAKAGIAEALSAHSLRSGFVTQTGIDNVHPADAMEMSGHRTERMLLRYYRAGRLEQSPAAHLSKRKPRA